VEAQPLLGGGSSVSGTVSTVGGSPLSFVLDLEGGGRQEAFPQQLAMQVVDDGVAGMGALNMSDFLLKHQTAVMGGGVLGGATRETWMGRSVGCGDVGYSGRAIEGPSVVSQGGEDRAAKPVVALGARLFSGVGFPCPHHCERVLSTKSNYNRHQLSFHPARV
jgi:hypothetical protein